jgi:2-desacetyl-2-hydroxyethyl bacteriochlorophyllide A dehydrogenase
MTATPEIYGRGRAVWFTSAKHPEILPADIRAPGPNEVTVRALTSLVSAGTEMLVYRGEISPDESLGVETCEGSFAFPIKYGYQVVGEVVAAGQDSGYKPGDRVFAKNPHQDLFTIRNDPSLLFRLPESVSADRATFANLLDVALNCNLDVPVRHGDVVVVYGQGIVGSFCAQLARKTAGTLIVVDPIAHRRERAVSWGADAAVDPADAREAVLAASDGRGADIAVEASGAPPALQSAIESVGKEGTIAVVSFFGGKTVPLVLSPQFHYGRQRIISSQVSSVGSGLQPRWSFARRLQTALRLLADPSLQAPVSHRIPLDQAAEAYRLIDEDPANVDSVLLTYE